MRLVTIIVYCDAESHAPKITTVGRFELREHGGSLHFVRGREDLVDDDRVASRDLWGTATRGPSRFDVTSSRSRHRLRCRRCGLEVQLRYETAERLAEGLVAAGESRVRLSALAATL